MTEQELRQAFADAGIPDAPMITIYKPSKRNLGKLTRSAGPLPGMTRKPSKPSKRSTAEVGYQSGGMQTQAGISILTGCQRETVQDLLAECAVALKLFKAGYIAPTSAHTELLESEPTVSVARSAKPFVHLGRVIHVNPYAKFDNGVATEERF